MELIDKTAIVAEIKRRIDLLKTNESGVFHAFASEMIIVEYENMLSFLDTLGVKEAAPKFKIGQRIKQGDTIAEIKEISKNGYHCDIAFVPFTAEGNWKLSLWSEEDDKLLYECKKEIWKGATNMLSLKHEKIEQWLESLKQRFKQAMEE